MSPEQSPQIPPQTPPPTDASGPRPVFKLIGCLTVLILTLTVGLLIALWMVTSGGLPREPLPLAPIDHPASPIDLPVNWHLGEAEASGSAEAWTSTVESWMTTAIQNGTLAKGSGFRCQSAPDGSLTLKVSLGIPEEDERHDYLKRGRYLNFTMTGEFYIAEGKVQKARLDEYRWGYIYTQQPGEVIDEETAKGIIERILGQLVELKFMPAGIQSLEHSPSQISVKLSPQ